MTRGFYIMLEGGEGCGKDFHADLLLSYLRNQNYGVVLTREPGGTLEAEKIREILLNKNHKLDSITELFLYEAARRDLNQKVILPEISCGRIVLSKRGFPSTIAYQGFGGGLDLEIINRENELAMQGIMPDLLFIIDINPETGLKKETSPDRFSAKGLDYHKKVREGYLYAAKRYSEISEIIPYIDGEPEKMQQQIRDIIEQRLKF